MARVVGTLSWVYARHEIVHCDPTPENLLLDENGRAFVADWGLAELLRMPDSPLGKAQKVSNLGYGLTRARAAACTIAYASPKQITGAADVDHEADVYSLEYSCPSGSIATSSKEQYN
jgi:eukaryotic-like serine/threonine-protein kinase